MATLNSEQYIQYLPYVAPCGILLYVLKCLWSYFRSPLRQFPGPSVAAFTDFWRMIDMYKGNADSTVINLHRKHGTAVRMGPNLISLSDPGLISTIYRTKNPWPKSEGYSVNDTMVRGQRMANLFSTTDDKFHEFVVGPIRKLYSMSKLQELEHCTDASIELFMKKLDERFVNSGKPCDMENYVRYWASDAMGQITFSEPLGLLQAGNDDKKFLDTLASSIAYFSRISQMPSLDVFFDKNPFLRMGPRGLSWAAIFGMEAIEKRRNEPKGTDRKADFLDWFMETREKHSWMDDNATVRYLLNNIVGGGDTTAITVTAVIYYVLKNPSVHEKLSEELRAFSSTPGPVSWKTAHQLPYLDAVIRETIRFFPAGGIILERIVPKGGLTLEDGRFIPEGTIVGMNPWVIARDKGVYGAETDRFIPERWLKKENESEEQFQDRRSKMQGAEMAFGSGYRQCLGKSVSRLQMYKVTATLFAKYNMRLKSPDHVWKRNNQFFVYQKDVPVLLSRK